MATMIEVRDLSERVEELLALTAAGEEVILVSDSQPRAKLIPIPQESRKRIAGLHPGAMVMTPDFDAPLPEEFWMGNS
jgi:antitoxin (DNA-binding transcriptional repressor) of toxin-antitoxin stability system